MVAASLPFSRGDSPASRHVPPAAAAAASATRCASTPRAATRTTATRRRARRRRIGPRRCRPAGPSRCAGGRDRARSHASRGRFRRAARENERTNKREVRRERSPAARADGERRGGSMAHPATNSPVIVAPRAPARACARPHAAGNGGRRVISIARAASARRNRARDRPEDRPAALHQSRDGRDVRGAPRGAWLLRARRATRLRSLCARRETTEGPRASLDRSRALPELNRACATTAGVASASHETPPLRPASRAPPRARKGASRLGRADRPFDRHPRLHQSGDR